MRDTQLLRRNVNRITNEEKRVVNDLLCRINKINVELSNHCVERENQRHISTKQVEECLRNAKFENVVEISCKEFRHKMTPRLVIVSDKVYRNENGRYRVAVVVNCRTLQIVTTYNAYLHNRYKEVQHDDWNFVEYLR